MLVIITLFIAIGFAIRVIAVIAAIVGVIILIGALIWLAIEELFKKKAP